MLQMDKMKKLTWVINTILIGYVIAVMGLYAHYHVTYMIYHSVVTAAVYLILYYFIYKEWLDVYLWSVYGVIIVYMLAATICLGCNYGFHLYCMSMIPLIFYTEYMAYKLHTRNPKAMPISIAIVVIYLACTGYATYRGPIYEINMSVSVLFMGINAISVFFFLITYTRLMLHMVLDSETKLSDMAHKDKLTGLFNRHYMLERLDNLKQNLSSDQWIAIVDIDNFKGVNDTYGHNCGDYVLIQLSEIVQNVCRKCVISRWGGEEFLITANKETQDQTVLENLRQAVESTKLSYQGQDFAISVTIGTSCFQSGQSLDTWIQDADKKLYQGKNSGKNRVIY